jgi:hypothetical protein
LVDHDRGQQLGIGIEGCLGEVSGQERPVSADQARHDVHGVRLASPGEGDFDAAGDLAEAFLHADKAAEPWARYAGRRIGGP